MDFSSSESPTFESVLIIHTVSYSFGFEFKIQTCFSIPNGRLGFAIYIVDLEKCGAFHSKCRGCRVKGFLLRNLREGWQRIGRKYRVLPNSPWKLTPPSQVWYFFFFCTQICWHSSLVNSSQQTMWSIASDIKQLFLVSHMGIGHWTIKDGWILPVIRLTWEGFDGKSKQSRSLGAEQPTQVRVYQLPLGIDGLASLA